MRASSQQAPATSRELPHFGAMALDRDPTTAWIDAGATGAVGEWLEVPVQRSGRLRALSITAGEPGAGLARAKRLRLGCFSLDGNAREPQEVDHLSVDLEDRAGEQRLVPRPLAECHSLRLTVQEVFGGPGTHVAIAELGILAPR